MYREDNHTVEAEVARHTVAVAVLKPELDVVDTDLGKTVVRVLTSPHST
jgi:hypothetical protein